MRKKYLIEQVGCLSKYIDSFFGHDSQSQLGQIDHLDEEYAICARLESGNPMKLQRF